MNRSDDIARQQDRDDTNKCLRETGEYRDQFTAKPAPPSIAESWDRLRALAYGLDATYDAMSKPKAEEGA